MLQPKKSKYRKQFRGKRSGTVSSGNTVAFGEFGLKAMSAGWFSARQIEAARKTISHHTKRAGKLWIRVFPDKPTTKKGPGVKMGAGKGDIHQYVAVIRPGRILFELGGLSEVEAREAFRKAAHKIGVRTHVVVRT
ncbi:MAG TPA: 50S ribosomal protein L16 [Candidatus Pacebacteria bacterium]|nr:MAG: 50S ribosomal protein L16 [Microgenomates group bacterium GW2011_GWB1_45_17]KKU23661.1 MAG: 50S ribosomal protein L16 [Microgenomates group bacterium GW2011_GWA1_46_15]KKU24562.1 MAG: 50S ribosomal protein L16 [Microgenomates group bacterium GW2011_GWC1_46_15]OGJ21765.1 MAG: 50S ribosomal protein L16 [Candidatus Pacebacteria bacterium RIFCSPHIGHO2_01_FULL_46_10]HAV15294.1 50S ribosomal protein L16 [Candidatus Paceibacterota bacterium]